MLVCLHMSATYKTIEEASHGETYRNAKGTFTVYQIGTYSRSSVLAGQQSRRFLDTYDSLEAAQAAHPTAEVQGSSYQPPSLGHLPDDGDSWGGW